VGRKKKKKKKHAQTWHCAVFAAPPMNLVDTIATCQPILSAIATAEWCQRDFCGQREQAELTTIIDMGSRKQLHRRMPSPSHVAFAEGIAW
jgi:hypothetical protein